MSAVSTSGRATLPSSPGGWDSVLSSIWQFGRILRDINAFYVGTSLSVNE
jgi:hypothetical protein